MPGRLLPTHVLRSHMDRAQVWRSTDAYPIPAEIAHEIVRLSEIQRRVETETPLIIIGWREWLSLPDLGIPRIKAKIDTGARSSSLHAYDIQPFEKDGCDLVRFKVHPVQRRDAVSVSCVAEVHDVRSVRSSSGEAADRIVIQTPVRWMGETWTVDLTLADRSQMGFRMLVGREAVRGKMLVDPGRSYFGGRPQKKRKQNNH